MSLVLIRYSPIIIIITEREIGRGGRRVGGGDRGVINVWPKTTSDFLHMILWSKQNQINMWTTSLAKQSAIWVRAMKCRTDNGLTIGCCTGLRAHTTQHTQKLTIIDVSLSPKKNARKPWPWPVSISADTSESLHGPLILTNERHFKCTQNCSNPWHWLNNCFQ